MKLIILDRDGVINYDSDKYIKNAEEWEPLPYSLDGIANLTQLGYKIVVCTNQSGIARGLFSIEDLNNIHEKMIKMVKLAGGEISAIFFCPHDNNDNCSCRKPKSGMIDDICDRFNLEDARDIMMVGDSERDLLAINGVGGIPVLVKTGNGKKTLSKGNVPSGTLVFENLLEVSEYLMTGEHDEK
jgi:D-glycero-D-manno-heptose 1,7-bisphosphate phosphatase